MSTIWFGLGIMAIPIAAYALIEKNNGILALMLFLMGVWAIIMALVEKNKEDKKENAKFWVQYQLAKQSSDTLIAEVKGLRGDLTDLRKDVKTLGGKYDAKERDTNL